MGKPLVNSLFTLGLMIGMLVNDTTFGTTLANLGMSDVRFPKPLFHGDSVKVRTTVRSKRESRSRPNEGVVNFFHEMMNQHGDVVATRERAALMRKRPVDTAACYGAGTPPASACAPSADTGRMRMRRPPRSG